jgi:predicted hydrocarbon binding protein
MPEPIELTDSGLGLVAITRESLLTLRTALFRDLGVNAAAILQEAGYSGGQVLLDAFARWLESRGLPSPESLPSSDFAARASEFLRSAGWGSIDVGTLESAATIDSADWAEADPASPMEFPGCYYSAGLLTDLFGRIIGEPVAVMEVECRSMGNDRCRFLVGAVETMQRVYDAMGEGLTYEQALSASTSAVGS